MRRIGYVLIVLGLLMSIITGFNLITKKKVVDLGKIEINKEEKTPIYWSPVLGIVLIGSGLILSITDKKRSI